MKVKNIMFFGFAAAILSAGAASAAVTPNSAQKNIVTSKYYVDSLISDVETAITENAGVQSVTTGNTNGNINVDGTQVPVYGLGSAAYTNTDAYEAAGTVKNGTLTLTGSTTNTTATFGANQEGNAAFTIRDLPAKPDSCTDDAPCALVQEGSSLTWKPMAQPGA